MEKTIEKDGLILSEDGKKVLGVTDNTITKVVVPEGVEVIEDWAFEKCYELQILKLPKSLKKNRFWRIHQHKTGICVFSRIMGTVLPIHF